MADFTIPGFPALGIAIDPVNDLVLIWSAGSASGSRTVHVPIATLLAATSPVQDGLSTSGTTQGTGYALVRGVYVFSTVAVGAGATLPDTGGMVEVLCRDSANDMLVWPAVGRQIEGLSTNAPKTILAPTGSVRFYSQTGAVWRMV